MFLNNKTFDWHVFIFTQVCPEKLNKWLQPWVFTDRLLLKRRNQHEDKDVYRKKERKEGKSLINCGSGNDQNTTDGKLRRICFRLGTKAHQLQLNCCFHCCETDEL